jgi:signal transduction histidine kinase
MFKSLRFQLTILYPLVGLAVVALVGGGTYAVIKYYLLIEYYPDIELEARMVEELKSLGISPPAEFRRQSELDQLLSKEAASGADSRKKIPVSIVYLDASGQMVDEVGEVGGQVLPDGIRGAQRRGRDLRTATLPDGSQVRYMTYRLLDRQDGIAYIQIGRRLTTDDLLINRLSLLVLIFGVGVAAIIALFSWWLAGRSVLPAQLAWEHQQQFIANASHELRTPITLIRANAEVALRPVTCEPRRKELLGDIIQECCHVSRLIEDLLLLSRLDARKLTLNKVPIPAAELLGEVHRQFSSLAEKADVSLIVESETGSLLGDRTRLRQVLMILIDNALKFTPTGGTISVAARKEGDQVVFIVEDTGVGISSRHLPHVFERFYRVDERDGKMESGSGLGLSIAKALVQALEGTIRLDSQPGHGTRVSVSFRGLH